MFAITYKIKLKYILACDNTKMKRNIFKTSNLSFEMNHELQA